MHKIPSSQDPTSLLRRIRSMIRPRTRLRALKKSIDALRRSAEEFVEALRRSARLRTWYDSSAPGVIVFLTPGKDIVNGGILSIASMHQESVHLKSEHGCEVIRCVPLGDPILRRYSQFRDPFFIFGLEQVLRFFNSARFILIHVPEIFVRRIAEQLESGTFPSLRNNQALGFNILLQNIDLVPTRGAVDVLRRRAPVTVTTAHEAYTRIVAEDRIGVRAEKLSVYLSPEQYSRRTYASKEDLLIVSPDAHPMKSEIILRIRNAFPSLTVLEIRGLTYETYKNTIARAKWAITFGEGLDGYFIESIFSGAVAFAVFNDRFFTADFRALSTVYDGYRALRDSICRDIARLDRAEVYADENARQFAICARHYSHETYVQNLRRFYQGWFSERITRDK